MPANTHQHGQRCNYCQRYYGTGLHDRHWLSGSCCHGICTHMLTSLSCSIRSHLPEWCYHQAHSTYFLPARLCLSCRSLQLRSHPPPAGAPAGWQLSQLRQQRRRTAQQMMRTRTQVGLCWVRGASNACVLVQRPTLICCWLLACRGGGSTAAGQLT